MARRNQRSEITALNFFFAAWKSRYGARTVSLVCLAALMSRRGTMSLLAVRLTVLISCSGVVVIFVVHLGL